MAYRYRETDLLVAGGLVLVLVMAAAKAASKTPPMQTPEPGPSHKMPSPAVPLPFSRGFEPGHHYTAQITLSGIQAAFAGAADVAAAVADATGMPVTATKTDTPNQYLARGIWTAPEAPFPDPLPPGVDWIRDDGPTV